MLQEANLDQTQIRFGNSEGEEEEEEEEEKEGEGEEKEEEERKRSRRAIIWIHASDRWAEVSTRVARPNDEFATSRSSSSSSSSPSRSLHHQQIY